MKRIILHWAVTKYQTTGLARHHYHFVVEGDGKVVAGEFSPEANERPQKGKYAAHTLRCNTGSIGISAAAMFGAKTEKDYGNYPITHEQLTAMCRKTAELCRKYKIPVTNKTVLSHAEVEKNLGIKQRGKWDIAVLPIHGITGAKECGDFIRTKVIQQMSELENAERAKLYPPKPKPVVVNTPKVTPTQVSAGVGTAIVVGSAVTFWDKISAWFGSFF